ncbi:MAG: hypothetical protein AB1772_05825 [Candidatus Zixiibacteriota bacterium]
MHMPTAFWFCHHAADPFFNMAFDECMLEHVNRQPDQILLRLYTWQPGAITIGVNQSLERAVRIEALGGTPLIRRITGGRAVYHDESELTYCVALNLDEVALPSQSRSVNTVYLRLAEGLRSFLEKIGVSAQIVRRTGLAPVSRVWDAEHPCFVSAARYELLAKGKKILASAQRQIGSAVLQHGSIKLRGVAFHPALPTMSKAFGGLPQSHDRSDVERKAEQFAREVAAVLGVAAEGQMCAANDLEAFVGLTDRWRSIREAPLMRRDLIEHHTGKDSLLV